MLGKTAVIGAGLMGGQIGLILALGSEETFLMSRKQATLDQTISDIHRYVDDLNRNGLLPNVKPESLLRRIHTTTSLEMAARGAEFIVESVFEDLEVKKDIFRRLDHTSNPDAILASNSSGLPITRIAEATERPERAVGSHFVQPAHIVPIVEVIKGEKTTHETVTRTVDLWRSLGKLPLRVNTDLPGFLVNRMQHAMIREAVYLLSKGISSAQDIDLAVTLGLGPRFTISGPLEQRDINGIDTHYMVAKHLWSQLSGWEEPLNAMKEKVDRGELGLKTGRGYYDWKDKNPNEVRRVRDEALIQRVREILSWRKATGLP